MTSKCFKNKCIVNNEFIFSSTKLRSWVNVQVSQTFNKSMEKMIYYFILKIRRINLGQICQQCQSKIDSLSKIPLDNISDWLDWDKQILWHQVNE